MTFDKTNDFNLELTDADLEEINGGLFIPGSFPNGMPGFEFKKPQVQYELPKIFSNGIPNPIEQIKDLNRF